MTKEELENLVGEDEQTKIESAHYTLPRNSPTSRMEMVYRRAKDNVIATAKEMGHDVSDEDINECSSASPRSNHIDLYVYCLV